MILIINLNTTIDKTHLVEHYRIDKVFRPEQTIKVGGGKGINVARVLNKLKIPCQVMGFLGGVNTRFVLNGFKKEKINFIPVSIKGDSRDITIVVDRANRTETVINENGPVVSCSEQDNFFRTFKKILPKIRFLAICGSVPLGIKADFYSTLIHAAKQQGIFTILDTSGTTLIKSISARPELIKPNQEEIRTITSGNSWLIKSDIKNLYQKGIKNVIVTFGRKGCLGYQGDKFISIKPPAVRKISTIGSGDAFTAGLLYSYSYNKSFSDALSFATACAAANTLKVGAGELDRSTVFSLLPQVKKKIS